MLKLADTIINLALESRISPAKGTLILYLLSQKLYQVSHTNLSTLLSAFNVFDNGRLNILIFNYDFRYTVYGKYSLH